MKNKQTAVEYIKKWSPLRIIMPLTVQLQPDEEIEPENLRQSQKIKKNITAWKFFLRKLRRNEGKEYLSTRAVVPN